MATSLLFRPFKAACPRLLACTLLLLGLGILPACAPMHTASPVYVPLTQNATSTYYYLEYQTFSQAMQRTAAQSRLSPEALARTLQYQKYAAQALDHVIAVDPSPSLYMERAFLFWNQEQVGEATSTLRKGLEHFPGDFTLTASLANAHLLENNLASAAEVLSGYLTTQENATIRERLGQLYVDSDQPEKAMDVLHKIPVKERSVDAQYQMARAEARLGHRKAAMESLKKIIKKNPNHLEAWVELAYQQELGKDYASAVGTYTEILAMAEKDEDIRQRIENGGGEGREDIRQRVVGLWLKLNDPDKALKIAFASSGSKTFILQASLMFLSEGFTAQASTLLDVLASTPPVPGEYFFYKAVIAHDGENNSAKALQFLDLVPESDPHYSQAMQFRIQLLSSLGRQDEALDLLEKGKRLFPGQNRFSLLQAGFYMENKEPEKARTVLEEAMKATPNDEDLLYQYGAVLDRLGERQKALAIMQRILDKNPDHADALNYIGYTLAEDGKDLERALSLIKKADDLKPENGYIVDSLAWAYFRLGKVEEAWKQIQRATTLAGEDATMWEHYADIAKALGKREQARKGYKKALKLKSETPERIEQKLRGL